MTLNKLAFEMLELRMIIEPSFVRLAAERASDKEIDVLRQKKEAVRAATAEFSVIRMLRSISI